MNPTGPRQRVEALDTLRDLALFGVLTVNLLTEFRISIFSQFLSGVADTGWDRAINFIVSVFVETKAFCLFSLLFGVGLAIQFEALAERDDRTILLVRRLAVLLMFGLLHLFLLWNGDILTEYAVAGLIALPFLFTSLEFLAVASAACLALFLAEPLLPLPSIVPSATWLRTHVEQAGQVYSAGSYRVIWEFQIAEIRQLLPLHLSVLPRTVGLFLMGAALWRARLPQTFVRPTVGHVTAAIVCGAAGLMLTAAGAFSAQSASAAQRHGLEIARLAAPVLMALAYAAVILMLASTTATRSLVAWAAPLGRMAFTNYIAQSIIFGAVFFGYGLGLFGKLGPAPALALGIGVYAAQAGFSRWWLARHRFGPLEWLWRRLMYLGREKLRPA